MKYCIGIDVGGTTIKFGIFEAEGRLLKKWEIPTRKGEGGTQFLKDAAASIREKLQELSISPEDVLGAGMGVPGPVVANGYVEVCVNLGLHKCYPAKLLSEELSGMNGYYVRYSDDMLFVGEDYGKAMDVLQKRLAEMEMKLNPKKVEYLTANKWFKFLGFSIKGHMISLSPGRIKSFQKNIEALTVRKRGMSLRKAVNAVNRYLYKGEYCWATQILPVCNVRRDLNELNKFVMDCLRGVSTGKRKVGGLGYVPARCDGCIVRGTGRNVTANRGKMPRVEGYLSIGCMQNALRTSRAAYNTLAASL